MQVSRKTVSGSVALSVRRRAEPVWVLRYRCPDHPNGSDRTLGKAWTKKSRAPQGYLTRAQAQAEAQAFMDKLSVSVPKDRRTVARATQEFIARCERKGLRGSTMHEYGRMAELVCQLEYREAQTWGEVAVALIDAHRVTAVHEELQDRGLSAGTINHWRRVLNGILGTEILLAAEWEWITPRIEARGEFAFYSPEELARLNQHAADGTDRAIYTLAAETGLRMSEIRGLPVGNVRYLVGSQPVNKLWVTQAYTNTGGFAGPKSHEIRAVPMSMNVQAVLRPFCEGKDDAALVFDRNGTLTEPICGMSLYRRFKMAAERAGLHPLRFHDLRHTFGSLAIQDFSPVAVQQMMGHANLSTTQRYLHVKEDPEASNKLTGRFVALASIENVTPLPLRPWRGRPARYPSGCPQCGEPKAPGQTYCIEHMREARRKSEKRKVS